MDPEQAAQALAGAVRSDLGLPPENQAAAAPAPEPAPQPASTPEPVAAPAPEADQDTLALKAVLDTLPPEAKIYLEKREREMQAVMTRRTQELAEQRKSVEEDIAFLERLRSDPYAALEFHGQLTEALVAAGMSPAQAVAEADAQVAQVQAQAAGDPIDPDDPLAKKVAELEQWKSQQEIALAQAEEARELDALTAELTRREMAIRQNNPTYKDEDIDAIYDLAFSPKLGGDLDAAQQAYEAMKSRFVTEFVQTKQAGGTQSEPLASGPAQVPTKFDTVEAAHTAAVEALRNVLARQ